jgi:hypothetical protein
MLRHLCLIPDRTWQPLFLKTDRGQFRRSPSATDVETNMTTPIDCALRVDVEIVDPHVRQHVFGSQRLWKGYVVV